MSDRLKELQRQRALAQEQLAWLEREIARETGGQVTTSSTPTTPVKGAETNRPVAQSTAPSADDILAQYQSQAKPVHSEVKRGCFIYFFAAFGLVGFGILALYFFRSR